MRIIEKIHTFFTRDPRYNHVLTQDEKDKGNITKMMNAVKRKQQEILMERLEHLQEVQKNKQIEEQIYLLERDMFEDDEEEDEEDESIEEKLLKVFEKIMNKDQPSQAGLTPATTVSQSPQELVQAIPEKIRKELRKKTPDEIRQLAKLHYPDLEPELIEQIIPLL